MTHRNYIVIKASGESDYPFTEANGWFLLSTLQTNSPSSETFDPTITAVLGQYGWDFGDGSLLTNDNAVQHTYETSATKTVKLFRKGTCEVTAVDFNSDKIIGTLDISSAIFNKITSIILNTNTGLTEILFPPAPSGVLSTINISGTGFLGVMDLALFTKFLANTAIQLQNNPELTGVTFAAALVTPGTISALKIDACNITGNLDLSMFTAFTASAQITLNNNVNMTGVTFTPSTISGNISAFHIYSTGIAGTLDLTKISRFTTAGNIYLHANPALTGVLFNSTIVGSIYSLYIYSTAITGTLDLSMFTSFAANSLILLNNNPNLTGITFSSTAVTGSIATMAIYSTKFTGILDLSIFTAFSTTANLLLNSNTLLIGVTFASAVTGTFSIIQLNECALAGTLNLSMFKNFTSSGTLNVSANPALTAVTLSPTATTGSARAMNFSGCAISYLDLTQFSSTINSVSWVFNMQSNGVTAANVNRMLVEINTIATSGFTGRQIILNGTNAAPDSTSGGYNGLAAKTALQGKGFTVTTN